MSGGGRFDFDDGGTYCGGWEDGKAHGFGVCTGPKGQGEYSGAWQFGFEISGVYMWPSGNSFEGQWLQGKRHGLGIESKGRWLYRGEWTQGFKGRYGVRHSTSSGAKYEGTWTTGLQDGYGVESYADGGTYQGQWLRGMRHGYGVRASVPYGLASHYRPKAMRSSLTSMRSEQEEDHVVKDRDRKVDEGRGGFVLQARSDEEPARRRSIFDKHGRSSLRKSLMSGLKLRKQKSTGDIQESPRRMGGGSVRSTISNSSRMSSESAHSALTSASQYTDSNQSFVSQDDITDINVTETYMGEWKNDKRAGFGVSERSDGLKYEGEWYNNKKFGYGVTTFKDGTKEEGKYKNNVLISSGKKSKLFLIRSSKLRERVDNAVGAAQRAAQIALQKADIAISRMANARAKSEQADMAAQKSREDSEVARIKAKEFAPEFHQPGSDIMRDWIHNNEGDNKAYSNAPPPMHSSKKREPPRSALLSSALDCALAGSSSQIVEKLHSLPTDSAPPPNHIPNHYSSADRIKHDSDAHRTPAIRPERFTTLLDPTVVNDHFDQYGTLSSSEASFPPPRDDSGLGHESPPEPSTPMSPPVPLPVQPQPVNTMQPNVTTPDSGLSDSSGSGERPLRPPLQRRKTLPSIMHRPPTIGAAPAPTAARAAAPAQQPKPEPESYIIENGVRKRIKAEVYKTPPSPTPSVVHGERPKELPKRYKLEKASGLRRGAANRGSLPDVSQCQELRKTVTPREEMHHLSEARRDELRRLREEEERRRQQEIVLRLGDIKDWCQQRQLLVLVIALNVSLATMFFNILSN